MKKIITTLLIIGFAVTSFSQSITNINDANSFLQAYFSPFGESLGAGLNNGWYNTAKPHKLGGFDVTLTLNTVSIPESSQSFNPNDLDNFSSSSNSTPTILGKGEGAIINYGGNEFTMPEQNLQLSYVPIPALNAGIGIFKKTEIDVRYVPTYEYKLGFAGKGSVGLWGVGVKHDLLQWIPVVGDAIPISLSLQIGHTNLNAKFDVESADAKQAVELNVKATTINLIASKKILMLTGYAGVGYNSSSTSFTADTDLKLGNVNNQIDFDVPLEMSFESVNEFRANIGIRFNLTVIAFQANHTFSKYPVTTLGVGVSLR